MGLNPLQLKSAIKEATQLEDISPPASSMNVLQSQYIHENKDEVILTSPTFGTKLKIKNPSVKFATDTDNLKELKHIETQIKNLELTPDFGYGTG